MWNVISEGVLWSRGALILGPTTEFGLTALINSKLILAHFVTHSSPLAMCCLLETAHRHTDPQTHMHTTFTYVFSSKLSLDVFFEVLSTKGTECLVRIGITLMIISQRVC